MKPKPQSDNSMQFERMLMLFFGKEAYQTAGQAATPKSRRHWIKRVLTHVMKSTNKIETTVRHKQLLMGNAEAAHDAIGKMNEPTWEFVYHLLNLIGRLLGFDYQRGGRFHTLSYWQTYGQYYGAIMCSGGDTIQDYYDKDDAVRMRQRIVLSLKQEGLSDFKVALVLDTTEHEVQQLRLGTHPRLRTIEFLQKLDSTFPQPDSKKSGQ